ncbi:hypothetical protein KA005_84040, partial [bacterium]|nr:hypothetical protein [bacterium]
WRRGDSNPKCIETEHLHINDNSATDCNVRRLEGHSAEQKNNTSEQFRTFPQHQLGANMVHQNGGDSDLAEIIQAWPTLPEHIKATIKLLLSSCQGHSLG